MAPAPGSSVTCGYDAASRLDTVTSGTNVAAYAYLANSPLVETVTFKQGGTTWMTATGRAKLKS